MLQKFTTPVPTVGWKAGNWLTVSTAFWVDSLASDIDNTVFKGSLEYVTMTEANKDKRK